jgi:hypothetical protein
MLKLVKILGRLLRELASDWLVTSCKCQENVAEVVNNNWPNRFASYGSTCIKPTNCWTGVQRPQNTTISCNESDVKTNELHLPPISGGNSNLKPLHVLAEGPWAIGECSTTFLWSLHRYSNPASFAFYWALRHMCIKSWLPKCLNQLTMSLDAAMKPSLYPLGSPPLWGQTAKNDLFAHVAASWKASVKRDMKYYSGNGDNQARQAINKKIKPL